MKDPRIAEAVATKHVQFPGYADKPGFQVNNDNRLLGVYPGFLGGKTGFTDDARHTYLGGAARGGHRLEVVLMHGEQHPVLMAQQGAQLFDYGFGLMGKAPVGQLVAEQVKPTEPAQPGAPQQGSGVRATTGPGAASSSSMTSVVLPVLVAVVLVAVIGLLLWRRRKPAAAGSGPSTIPPPNESEETRPIG
jgi:D-alanyl-D-alanine carboxypeptidase (penicillin-binding protein 5/6)